MKKTRYALTRSEFGCWVINDHFYSPPRAEFSHIHEKEAIEHLNELNKKDELNEQSENQ
jgi:hypothetical protein